MKNKKCTIADFEIDQILQKPNQNMYIIDIDLKIFILEEIKKCVDWKAFKIIISHQVKVIFFFHEVIF